MNHALGNFKVRFPVKKFQVCLLALGGFFIFMLFMYAGDKSSGSLLNKIYQPVDRGNDVYSPPRRTPLRRLSNYSFAKWIVVTTINPPIDQMKKLASQTDGFKLLALADLKTDPSWSIDNAIFVSVDQQKQMGYQLNDMLPYNSYARKNIGYLYAIQYGAKFIYDTDDDNAPSIDKTLTEYFNLDNDYEYGLVYDCSIEERAPNVYAHFGQPLMWPRGIPLTNIKKNFNNSYILTKRKVSAVQQGVVDGDPDVDAIFRLTKTMNDQRIDLYFDSSAPSIQLPMNKVSAYNAQNTMIRYNAFWSLYLPFTVTVRETDIWRSYWAQRLMWMIDETLSFYGPNAYQLRSVHSYLRDFTLEKKLYLETEKLIAFLYEWNCPNKEFSFYDCVMDLSAKMAEKDFWRKEEVPAIRAWLDDLTAMGYKEPEIVNREPASGERLCAESMKSAEKTRVRYTPRFQKPIELMYYYDNNKLSLEDNDRLQSLSFFRTLCKEELNLSQSSIDRFLFSNHNLRNSNRLNITLVIVVTEKTTDQVIELLNHQARYWFHNVMFCGKNFDSVLTIERGAYRKFDSFTFINTKAPNCMTKAMQMGLNTDGFLLASSDIVIKYWTLKDLDNKKPWSSSDPNRLAYLPQNSPKSKMNSASVTLNGISSDPDKNPNLQEFIKSDYVYLDMLKFDLSLIRKDYCLNFIEKIL